MARAPSAIRGEADSRERTRTSTARATAPREPRGRAGIDGTTLLGDAPAPANVAAWPIGAGPSVDDVDDSVSARFLGHLWFDVPPPSGAVAATRSDSIWVSPVPTLPRPEPLNMPPRLRLPALGQACLCRWEKTYAE